MADTELLPCPFCGGTDTFVERADYSSAFVVCDSRVDEHSVCMARGPIAVQDDDGEEIPGGAGAIAAWNRRAALASRPAEVDEAWVLLFEALPHISPQAVSWVIARVGPIEDAYIHTRIRKYLERVAAPSKTTNKGGT